jgi:hypothetical protein
VGCGRVFPALSPPAPSFLSLDAGRRNRRWAHAEISQGRSPHKHAGAHRAPPSPWEVRLPCPPVTEACQGGSQGTGPGQDVEGGPGVQIPSQPQSSPECILWDKWLLPVDQSRPQLLGL